MNKKLLALLLAATMLFTSLVPVVAQETQEAQEATQPQVTVTLDGQDIDFGDIVPTLVYDITYVPQWFFFTLLPEGTVLPDVDMLPLRSTLEPFGFTLEWHQETRTANILPPHQEAVASNIHMVLTHFMDLWVAGDYEAAQGLLMPEFYAALGAIPLQFHLSGRHGRLMDYTILEVTEAQGLYSAMVHATHEKATVLHNIFAFEPGMIVGFIPIQVDFEPMLPPEHATYTGEAITIGADTPWALEGLLTIPENASEENPVPAIILIPGSGANNMDASIFQNRPFFDIADYLSSNGVAVLRYNERAFTHGFAMAQTLGLAQTVYEEYIADAFLAAQILRDDPRISHVFILGHSLGGIVAPRIAAEAALDGVVIMASSPRPLHLIWYDQSQQHISDTLDRGDMDLEAAEAARALLATQLAEAEAIGTMTPEALATTILFDTFPAMYELSIIQSLPLPFIGRYHTPVLVVQGGRDFQTTVADDFQLFVEGTQGMDHVTLILYDGLNHLMMPAYRQEGPLVIDVMEYAIPGTVCPEFLADLLAWIMAQVEAFHG